MINPALKAALLSWDNAILCCDRANFCNDAECYGHFNSERLAALAEIRKLVEMGKFDEPLSHVIPSETVNLTHQI